MQAEPRGPAGSHALAARTTLRLGGPARAWVRAETESALADAVAAADAAGEPVLVLGGGSNVVVADDGFPGTVVEVATTGIEADGTRVRVAAGEDWDALVAHAVDRDWSGIEALSGIPGSVGATPVQNVGAYGQEVSQTIAEVRVWDRRAGEVRNYPADECDFGYRTSRFKADRYDDRGGAHVVLSVTFDLAEGPLGAPVAYAELARHLGVAVGERAPASDVRSAVLGLRRGKGMVLDPDDHDTWSAGSFFTNPIIAPDRVPDGAPAFATDDPDLVKTSAAWLIEHAGFGKGHPGSGAARLSTKHTLALTNRGSATTADLLALAREVRDGVREAYGITLVNEPVLVGCTL
ncbi:UDP-N-acetylmuramate dehydrogenase [Nocardioides panacisoli]|uniref:UDP-N-acetylmuramate dehydrogenase n=1 Tax=Nocardioides panacisoli TaxID=627624 RepID=UPI001C63B2EF|nr:UDP-N-acetylmuramate dehydrogenase [Nocardioides panacisoli]QYJ05863.1 UDP-N-acetylmuramate dehydrogenase [Nocardioides panacisoli]